MAVKAYRNSNLLGAIHEIVPTPGTTFYSVWHEAGHRADDVPVAAGTTSIKFFFDPSFPGAIWEDADGERGGIFRFWRNDEEPEAFAFTVPATGGEGTDPGAGGGGGNTTLPDLSPSPAGTKGSATRSVVATVNAKGLVTAFSDVAIPVPPSPIPPGSAVTRIVAGANVTVSPATGVGDVTISAAAAGGGGGVTLPDLSPSPAGTIGDATHAVTVTINAKGLVTGASAFPIAFPPPSGGGTTLPDLSPSPAGAFGDATHTAHVTVNAKGLVTAVSAVPIATGVGGGIPEAPTDGQLYARKSSAWAAFSIGPGGVVYNFPQSLLDAFNNSTALNWLGGDVILPAPLDFLADSNKIGFSLDGNRARITSAFNNANAPALKFRIANGGISIREFAIENLTFSGSSPYIGGVTFECLRNDSWIYSFVMNGIVASGHSGHGVWCRGSVFEAQFDTMSTTQGLGLFRATTEGPSGNVGLPSALIGKNWRPRDFNGNGVQLDSPVAYTEPFDLRLSEGYFVTGLGPGNGISAPSGITSVEGVGFENIQNSAVYVGYRGGRFRDVQGTNAGGMPNLVHAQLVGSLTLDGCSVENENAGSGVKLALIEDLGGGLCVLNPTRSDQNGNDIDGNLPKASYSIVSYRPKT